MALTLKIATALDCPKIHEIQVKAFGPLLEKYQDVETNPAAETLERIVQRFEQSFTDYFLICLDGQYIGALRVCNYGDVCRLSPICILPEYQGNGYAQQAMRQAEALYPGAIKWTLETILQEDGLCRLYEKIGYVRTGEVKPLKPDMDLVYYEKKLGR